MSVDLLFLPPQTFAFYFFLYSKTFEGGCKKIRNYKRENSSSSNTPESSILLKNFSIKVHG